MPYNGASNGSGGAGGGGGGATIVVSEGPQNKKIRTGVQQPGENDVHMHARSTQQQNQQQALMNKSNDDLRRKRPETTRPNHILLFTIINPFYPITVDVLHKICHPHGQVLRIVIFKKNGVQAMVEFDNLDAATRARENLNGADIYAGCCTLKIDYAKPEKLNVYKNEPDTSWDYTLSTGEMQMQMHGTGSGTGTGSDTDASRMVVVGLDLDDDHPYMENMDKDEDEGDKEFMDMENIEVDKDEQRQRYNAGSKSKHRSSTTTILTDTTTSATTNTNTNTTTTTTITTTIPAISSRYKPKSYLNRSLKRCLTAAG
ncbi:uncharacterized protein LOC117592453 isoform X17 [Drosophila guanche]|uniref:uncharacterized protein LOC117592453 isoform X17 n=1 Tax=Drosophila guanche TaxID=7266 RepID=UPI0014725D26|nr:uncharacterized protein LOC117592453 isoform X17 [Drosophila guanche]